MGLVLSFLPPRGSWRLISPAKCLVFNLIYEVTLKQNNPLKCVLPSFNLDLGTLLLLLFTRLFYLFVYCAHGQLLGVSLLGTWGLNSGRQAWLQALLPAEPIRWPIILFYF